MKSILTIIISGSFAFGTSIAAEVYKPLVSLNTAALASAAKKGGAALVDLKGRPILVTGIVIELGTTIALDSHTPGFRIDVTPPNGSELHAGEAIALICENFQTSNAGMLLRPCRKAFPASH